MNALPSTSLLAAAVTAGLLTASPAEAHDLYFAGSSFGQIMKGNPAQGDFQFLGACGGPAQSLCLHGDSLFIGDQGGTIYHYDPQNGFPTYAFDSANDSTAVLMDGGDLLVGGTDGTVLRYDTAGTLLQTYTPGIPVEALLIKGNDLFVGSSFGVVFKADMNDGLFNFWGTCGGPVQSMTSGGGSVFLGTTGGIIYRLDAQTQQVTATFAGGNDARALAMHMGDLLVGGSDGTIHRISPDDGRLFATIDAGFDIEGIVLGAELEPGSGYCFGSACPCGNSDAGAGCANTTGVGAKLRASGTPSISSDDLFMTVSGLPTNQFGAFYMGAAQNTMPFGNGILCAGAGGYGQFRFPAQNSGQGGFLSLGLGVVAHSQANFGALGQILPGQVWNFQAWYRDPGGACGSSFNTSNGYTVSFLP